MRKRQITGTITSTGYVHLRFRENTTPRPSAISDYENYLRRVASLHGRSSDVSKKHAAFVKIVSVLGGHFRNVKPPSNQIKNFVPSQRHEFLSFYQMKRTTR